MVQQEHYHKYAYISQQCNDGVVYLANGNCKEAITFFSRALRAVQQLGTLSSEQQHEINVSSSPPVLEGYENSWREPPAANLRLEPYPIPQPRSQQQEPQTRTSGDLFFQAMRLLLIPPPTTSRDDVMNGISADAGMAPNPAVPEASDSHQEENFQNNHSCFQQAPNGGGSNEEATNYTSSSSPENKTIFCANMLGTIMIFNLALAYLMCAEQQDANAFSFSWSTSTIPSNENSTTTSNTSSTIMKTKTRAILNKAARLYELGFQLLKTREDNAEQQPPAAGGSLLIRTNIATQCTSEEEQGGRSCDDVLEMQFDKKSTMMILVAANNLGIIYRQLGNFESCNECFERLLVDVIILLAIDDDQRATAEAEAVQNASSSSTNHYFGTVLSNGGVGLAPPPNTGSLYYLQQFLRQRQEDEDYTNVLQDIWWNTSSMLGNPRPAAPAA